MTSFEQYLINNGYIKYVFDCKEWKYKKTDKHFLSTMVNLDHRYFHKSDGIIDKISSGQPITRQDRKGEIIFGLHESGKPPTLIYPRPEINGTRQYNDDVMNDMLNNIPPQEMLKLMYA